MGVPIGSAPVDEGYVTEPITPNTVGTAQGGGWGRGETGGQNGLYSSLMDPELWKSIMGLSNSIMNRPKDGKWQEIPLPQEIKDVFNMGMGYAKDSPTRNLVAPWAMGLAQASGIPQFEMTPLVKGPGIPQTSRPDGKTYQSGGTGQLDFGAFQQQFMNYIAGKGAGKAAGGPRDLSNVVGPAGNPIGRKGDGRPPGGMNKDMGEWGDFNREGFGGRTSFDRASDGSDGAPGQRDEFGMMTEGWRQGRTPAEIERLKQAGKDPYVGMTPEQVIQAVSYDKWMTEMPRDQFLAESKKQHEFMQSMKKYGGAAVKALATDPYFWASLITGTPEIYLANKLKQLATGQAQGAATNAIQRGYQGAREWWNNRKGGNDGSKP